MVALAAVAGVRVLAGKHAHGTLVEQAQFLHAAGVPAEDALAAACWAPRAYLGLPGIEPDAPAHLAIYASDPRSGLETLHEPELIVLAGRVIPAIHRS